MQETPQILEQNKRPITRPDLEDEEIKKFGQEKRPNELLIQLELVRKWMARRDHRTLAIELNEPFERIALLYEYLAGLLLKKDLGVLKKEDLVRKAKADSINLPQLLRAYSRILAKILSEKRAEVHQKFEEALAKKGRNQELESAIAKTIIKLGGRLHPEQEQILRENFPSGNFLLHTAGVKEVILIIESGHILSSLEVARKMKVPWGQGGQEGISFNLNNIRVLTGDARHFVAFIVDPMTILSDKTKLSLPEYAAKHEVQLVPRSYKRYAINVRKLGGGTRPDNRGVYPDEELPRVAVEDTFIFCNELDQGVIKEILAAYGVKPKGIITYPNKEIRVESWTEPTGDHVIADRLINGTLTGAGVVHSIDWNFDLFPRNPRISEDTYVGKDDIDNSHSVIKTDKGLGITDKDGRIVKIVPIVQEQIAA